MNKINTEDILGGLVIIILILIIVYASLFIIKTVDTEAKCLKLGWADYAVAFNLSTYCIREENEYEITVPLNLVILDSLDKGAEYMNGGG